LVQRNRLQKAIAPTVQRVAGSRWFARVAPPVIPRLDRVLHRITGGRVIMSQYLVPSIVLTTRGRRSGLPREVPLACVLEPDGSFVVAGSNFGRDHHPVWTANLLADPEAVVSHRGHLIPVTARLLEGAERTEVWPHLLEIWPVYDRYVERSGRVLRIFRLIPRTDT
jgi:deazaflavin-dependent oxidoreductase (nitroreductase family)